MSLVKNQHGGFDNKTSQNLKRCCEVCKQKLICKSYVPKHLLLQILTLRVVISNFKQTSICCYFLKHDCIKLVVVLFLFTGKQTSPCKCQTILLYTCATFHNKPSPLPNVFLLWPTLSSSSASTDSGWLDFAGTCWQPCSWCATTWAQDGFQPLVWNQLMAVVVVVAVVAALLMLSLLLLLWLLFLLVGCSLRVCFS